MYLNNYTKEESILLNEVFSLYKIHELDPLKMYNIVPGWKKTDKIKLDSRITCKNLTIPKNMTSLLDLIPYKQFCEDLIIKIKENYVLTYEFVNDMNNINLYFDNIKCKNTALIISALYFNKQTNDFFCYKSNKIYIQNLKVYDSTKCREYNLVQEWLKNKKLFNLINVSEFSERKIKVLKNQIKQLYIEKYKPIFDNVIKEMKNKYKQKIVEKHKALFDNVIKEMKSKYKFFLSGQNILNTQDTQDTHDTYDTFEIIN